MISLNYDLKHCSFHYLSAPILPSELVAAAGAAAVAKLDFRLGVPAAELRSRCWKPTAWIRCLPDATEFCPPDVDSSWAAVKRKKGREERVIISTYFRNRVYAIWQDKTYRRSR